MKVTKALDKVSGAEQVECDAIERGREVIRLSVEIEMRQCNITKMGAILAKAKDTVREAQSRKDYEHLRLHKAAQRQKELETDDG